MKKKMTLPGLRFAMIEKRAKDLTGGRLRIWWKVTDGAHWSLINDAPEDSPVSRASNLIELSNLAVRWIDKLINR